MPLTAAFLLSLWIFDFTRMLWAQIRHILALL